MAKKIILIVVGAVLLLCGLGVTVPGVVLTVVTGGNGTIESGFHDLRTNTPALVSTTATLSDGSSMPASGFGATKITVTARSSNQAVFLGVGRANDVDRFLSGVAYDEVQELRLSPFRLRTTTHGGAPFANSPSHEQFWVASARGDNPTLEWQVASGDYRLVLMNDDGSPGVDAQTQFGTNVKGLHGVGVGALIAGIVVALVGIAMIIWGIRTRGRPAQPVPASGYPTVEGQTTPTGYGQPPPPEPYSPDQPPPTQPYTPPPSYTPPPTYPPPPTSGESPPPAPPGQSGYEPPPASGPTGTEPPPPPPGYEPPPSEGQRPPS